MYRDTLARIRERVAGSRMLPERKTEVAGLLDELEKEMGRLENSGTGNAPLDAAAKLAEQPQPGTLRRLEIDYPAMTRLLNRLCMMLADSGL